MTKHQITQAARLYALAIVANLDEGGADTEETQAVVRRAIQQATADLARLGVAPGDVVSMADCIRIAKS